MKTFLFAATLSIVHSQPAMVQKWGNNTVWEHNQFKLPSTDKRSYRTIILNNNLMATVISDPNTDRSAAAVDVGIGYFEDAPNLPGLAHLLERVLVSGSTT